MQSNRFNTFLQSLCLCAFLVFTSCGTDPYNVSDPKKVKDVRENDSDVYGEKKGPAKQLANKYTDTPESKQRAEAIREKLFGAPKGDMATDGNTKKDDKKEEKKETKEVKKEEKKEEKKS